ncbi:MAG: hypothetical protein IJO32_05165 [Bacilli bacterium]|nr:hypothetical protein [Bacilli bacterium]
MESSLEFIRNMSKYFSNYDKNFVDGFIKIIQKFYEYLVKEQIINSPSDIDNYIDKFYNKMINDTGISPNESIRKALAFFYSLGSKYEEMSVNLLNETKITKGENTDSHAYNIKLSGNEYDDSVIVHEITHSIVMSEEQINRPIYIAVPKEEYSPIFHFISEINSYIFQFLYYDFCEAKSDVKRDRLDMMMHMMVISSLKSNFEVLEKDKTIFETLSCGKAQEHISEVIKHFGFDPSTNQYNSQYAFSEKMILSYSHPFGMMVACYIYQEILKNPNNIKMCLGLEKAQGMVGEEETTLRILESLGIPCFKNGKISLDDECVNKLSNALIETFDMCKNKEKKSDNSFLNKYPIVDDVYMEQVNGLFDKTIQKLR